jgi:sec-independent protein translocase protein TatA
VFGIGPIELVLVLAIVLMVFGAKRLPEMGRSLGSGMREFKEGITNPSGDEIAKGGEPDAPNVPKVRSAHD